MYYLLHRIKEANGFIAQRAIFDAWQVASTAYGNCVLSTDGKRVVTPEMYLAIILYTTA
jgi:hypothetical protein